MTYLILALSRCPPCYPTCIYVTKYNLTQFAYPTVNNKPVESGDELPDAVMNKTLDISDPTNVRSNTTMEMDIDTDLDNNNNTSSSKMGN